MNNREALKVWAMRTVGIEDSYARCHASDLEDWDVWQSPWDGTIQAAVVDGFNGDELTGDRRMSIDDLVGELDEIRIEWEQL